MIIHVDWKTWLVSPLLAHHPSQNPEPWRALLQEHGFTVEEEGIAVRDAVFWRRSRAPLQPFTSFIDPSG